MRQIFLCILLLSLCISRIQSFLSIPPKIKTHVPYYQILPQLLTSEHRTTTTVTSLHRSKECCNPETPKEPVANSEEEGDFDFEFIESKSDSDVKNDKIIIDDNKTSNNKSIIAFISSFVGVLLFTLTQSQPAVSGIALLKTMEADSLPVEVRVYMILYYTARIYTTLYYNIILIYIRHQYCMISNTTI